MSMHKQPLTKVEEAGLRQHGLPVGVPSQLSDAFRQGVAFGIAAERERQSEAGEALVDAYRAKYQRRATGGIREGAPLRQEFGIFIAALRAKVGV